MPSNILEAFQVYLDYYAKIETYILALFSSFATIPRWSKKEFTQV